MKARKFTKIGAELQPDQTKVKLKFANRAGGDAQPTPKLQAVGQPSRLSAWEIERYQTLFEDEVSKEDSPHQV